MEITHVNLPLNYPIVWLIFSWLVWLILKLFKWHRPSASSMLIYSAAVIIVFIRAVQDQQTCMRLELCSANFELFSFVTGVAFWFIILYVSTTLNLGAIFKWGTHGWLGFLIIALGAWYLIVETIKIIGLLKIPIGIEISVQALSLWLLIPWLLWMLLIGLWRSPQPTVRIMFMYSVSVVLTYIRVMNDAMMSEVLCGLRGINCQETFSLISFLVEAAYWFVPLYAFLKLTLKMETKHLSVATS